MRPHNAVPAKEVLFAAEHVHRAALAARVATFPPREFCHHAVRVHSASQHVAMVTVAGNHLVAFFQAGLHAGDHRFLTDIEVTKARNLTHAVELAGLFFKPTDQQHFTVILQQICFRRFSKCLFRTLRFCRHVIVPSLKQLWPSISATARQNTYANSQT